jgi:hypothetical protein
MDLLASYDTVPPAHELPPGAVVLSLQGAERVDLQRSVIIWAVLLLGSGAVLGYLVARRKR